MGEASSVISFNPTGIISFNTKNLNGPVAGSFTYSINVMMAMANYTMVSPISISYTFNLKPCIVKTIVPSWLNSNANIAIGGAPSMLNLPDFDLDPRCGY